MTDAPGRWDDLVARLASGAVIAIVGLGAVWLGERWFHGFVALVCAVMVWELARMTGAGRLARWPAVAAGAALMIGGELPEGLALPLIVAPALFRTDGMRGHRARFALYAVAILIAGYGLMALRDDFGLRWMIWLAVVVIATDIGGYFAGRLLGGPRIWPRLSPKKTWSGTVAGWAVAAACSIPFVLKGGVGWELLGIAVAISMASQLGDVAESALKRHSGVKDSSSIIPGHGGLMDRFDSMLGASIFLLLIEAVVDFPPPPLV